MSRENSIDATDLICMPLPCLEELVGEIEDGAPGLTFVLGVIRWAAVLLICGTVELDGSSKQESTQRGFDMLAILRAKSGT